jgi:hypothetical protein
VVEGLEGFELCCVFVWGDEFVLLDVQFEMVLGWVVVEVGV